MQIVKVEVLPIREGESVVANLIVEGRKGETWNRVKVITVTSGTPESQRQIVLQDGERLVVEGESKKVVVYDREQNMAKQVDADPEVRAKQEAAEQAQRDANVARENQQNALLDAKAKLDRESQAKTNLGNPVPSTPPATGTQEPNKSLDPKSGQAPSSAGSTPQTMTPTQNDHGQGATPSKPATGTVSGSPTSTPSSNPGAKKS